MSSSVSGVTSSNSSSIYGTRNVLSGLATGLDTESMIQNAVSGYNTKITSLQQKQTKLTWKQEAYRDITDPMVQFSRKYTSYTSSTNLYSASFFNNAVTTTTGGENASEVSASGKTSSDVQILGIKQLAAASTYRVSASTLLGGTTADANATVTGTEVDPSDQLTLSAVSGTLTLAYGTSRTIDLSFDDLETYGSADEFLNAINKKLADYSLTNSDGDTVAASTMVKAELDASNNIVFSDNQDAGNNVTITGATGKIATTLNVDTSGSSSTLTVGSTALTDTNGTNGEYLSGKTISLTIDGTTKTITLPDYVTTGTDSANTAQFVTDLNTAVQTAFGSTVSVSNASASADSGSLTLQITGQKGSTISVSAASAVGGALGLGSGTATSYLDVGKTLEDLLGSGATDDNKLVINGVTIGTYSKDTALETILSDINANSDVGVNVSFSKTTNSFLFTSEETGSANQISIAANTTDDSGSSISNLAAQLFGTVSGGTSTTGTYTAGKDAVLSMEVNGQKYDDISRSSNNFNVDGLSVTLKGTFGYSGDTLDTGADPITFTTTADADTIVDAVSGMVDDLNAIMKSVHDAYSTQPLTKSDGSSYDPLTDDDESDMSDSAIEKYEEKAKTGLLFGDSDLSSLYSKLLSAVQSSGTAGATLRSMGITTSYSDGLTVLSVDEDALRDALETDPDSVRDAFTSTTGTGGLMTNLKSVMDTYASTTGATKGVLIQKAGSTYSSLSLLSNDLQDQVDDLDDQIDKWQDKLSDKIDYYTSLFTKLETLTSEMNSQSSMLSSMLGS